MEEQSYSKHSKLVPGFHFVLFGLIVIAIVLSLVNLYRRLHIANGRITIIALAINSISMLLMFYYARTFPMKVQDRAIRAEENLRHFVLTGKPLDHRLTVKQIIGLRFASDAELPELARRAADESLSPDAIKKSVKSWRPDFDRA
jgi:hypothetical protein